MVYKTQPIKESLGGLEVSHLTFSEALLSRRALVFRGRASFCILGGGAPRHNKLVLLRHASFSFVATSMATTVNEMFYGVNEC